MILVSRRVCPAGIFFMQALLLTEYRQLELTTLDRPTVGPEDVLVSVRACGICGSDVHGYDGSTGRRIPPLVMGHESAGVVAEVGANVASIRPGDHVALDSLLSCGECDVCRQGQTNMCAGRRILGVACPEFRQQGAFAEFIVVPEQAVHPVPNDLPFEHAALVEPVSVALHAVGRLRIDLGDSAAVVGSGMIGLLVIQALKIAGCDEVIAIDLDDDRLRLAAELGATATVNSANCDAVAAVLERTAGRGVDVALEVVGAAKPLATAIGCVRRGGQIGLVGNLAAEVPLPLQTVVMRELALFGSCASAGEYPRAIELIANGAIQVAPLISAIAPLADGPRWFERLYAREPGLLKVVLCPTFD
jgi:L-iditol 2-dehydrogenase